MKHELARTLKLKKFWQITSVLLTCSTLLVGISLRIPLLTTLIGIISIGSTALAFCYHKKAKALKMYALFGSIFPTLFKPAEAECDTGSKEKAGDPKEK